MSKNFAADISRIARKFEMRIDEVARDTFVDLFTSIVDSTPVDKGFLRNRWTPSIKTPNVSSQAGPDPSGTRAKAMVHATIRKPALYYFTNNMHYAEKIEFYGGSPNQAPQGMVRINMRRVKQILRENSR